MPSAQDILLTLLLAGGLPALLAAALMAVGCVIGTRFEATPSVASAVALAGGMALGNTIADHDWLVPWTPDRQAWTWLPQVVAAALAAGVVAHMPRVPSALSWGLCGMVAAHAGWLLVPRDLTNEHLWAPLVLGAAIFAVWVVTEQVGRFDPAGLVPLLLVPSALSVAVLLAPGSARFAQVGLILAGSLLGVGATALVMRREGSGVAPGVAIVIPALLLTIWHTVYSDAESAVPPVPSLVLAALSPLALAPCLIPTWRRYQWRGLWAVQLLLILLPTGGAVWMAARVGALEMDGE